MKTKKTTKSAARDAGHELDTAGREYDFETWGLLSRRFDGDGKWYGRTNYKTEKDAQEALATMRKQGRYFDMGGGFCIDFGAVKDLVEYKIVHYIQHATVKHVEVLKI